MVRRSSVPLFNDIKARIKLEAEELTAQKYAEKRAREEQAKQQKSTTKAEMNRRAKAMKSANSLGGERPVKESGIRARFCEWILVQAESLIFILFWFGLLVTLVLGFVYTIGYVAMSGSAAFELAVGILGTLISVALYVVLFVCSAAPIIALLRIAENTRVMAEQSCYG